MIPSDPRDEYSRTASRGPCFLYVTPCAYEDILKVGFARDPLVRLHTLHRRFYDFFDLDAGFLIETDSVREARALETMLHRALAIHNAPAPLVVREQAGGHTEWFRGAYAILDERARSLEQEGFIRHPSLRPWLRHRLLGQSTELYAWADKAFGELSLEPEVPVQVSPLRQGFRDTLDAYVALDIDLVPLLPDEVLQWHRVGARF